MKKSIWLSLMDTQGMCHTMLFTTHVGTKTICKKVNLLSDSDTHKDPRNGGLGDKPTVFENHRKKSNSALQAKFNRQVNFNRKEVENSNATFGVILKHCETRQSVMERNDWDKKRRKN